MRESRRDKALRYLGEDRVTVTLAYEEGVVLIVRGHEGDYKVRFGCFQGSPTAECSCPAIPGSCAHLEIAKLLWRKGDEKLLGRRTQ